MIYSLYLLVYTHIYTYKHIIRTEIYIKLQPDADDLTQKYQENVEFERLYDGLVSFKKVYNHVNVPVLFEILK